MRIEPITFIDIALDTTSNAHHWTTVATYTVIINNDYLNINLANIHCI